VLAAGKHTIVFDFQPDEAGFGKGSTGVLKRNVLLLKSGSTKSMTLRGGSEHPINPVLRLGNGIRFGLRRRLRAVAM
jgi:hypothetical protein